MGKTTNLNWLAGFLPSKLCSSFIIVEKKQANLFFGDFFCELVRWLDPSEGSEQANKKPPGCMQGKEIIFQAALRFGGGWTTQLGGWILNPNGFEQKPEKQAANVQNPRF